MASFLEYPITLYKHRGTDNEVSKVAKTALEATELELAGWERLASALPADASGEAAPAPPDFLEFPKCLYRGEGDALESKVVKNADEQDAEIAAGWRLSVLADAAPAADDAPAADEPKGKKKKSVN